MPIESISVPLPNNIPSEYEYLLLEKVNYECRKPKIKKNRNAFVSHEGLVLKHGRLVKGCAFNLSSKYDKSFYYTFWKTTIEQFAVSKWGKSIPSVRFSENEPVVVIHSKWFNYAFWINSYLPRLIAAKDAGLFDQGARLIFPESWKTKPFVQQSLSLFKVPFTVIPSGYQIFAETLYMPETREYTATFYPPTIQTTSTRIKQLLGIKEIVIPKTKVYLSRKQRGVRSVENEDEIKQILLEHGYTIHEFEGMSFIDQVNLMHNCSHFISLHGAGCSNIMFMQNGSSMLELVNESYAKAEYTFPFWKLSNATKLQYYIQFCPIVSKSSGHALSYGKSDLAESDFLVNQNVVVDLDLFKENLIRMDKT